MDTSAVVAFITGDAIPAIAAVAGASLVLIVGLKVWGRLREAGGAGRGSRGDYFEQQHQAMMDSWDSSNREPSISGPGVGAYMDPNGGGFSREDASERRAALRMEVSQLSYTMQSGNGDYDTKEQLDAARAELKSLDATLGTDARGGPGPWHTDGNARYR